MVRTPAQAHPLSIAHMPAKWSRQSAPAEHCACQPNGKNTRSSASAQHCTHASQLVRTPAQAHPLSTAHMPGKCYKLPLKCVRSALHTCLANGKNTRSSAAAQHCTHASQMVPPKCARSALHTCQPSGKNTRSSASAQHCTHASQLVRTPAQAHPLSTAHMPGKW